MTTKLTIIPVALAAAIALNLSTTESAAQYDAALSRQVHRIDSIAHDLSSEFRIHFDHTRSFRHMSSDIKSIISRVHHIDRLSHTPYASLRHIASDLRELDRLAHHLHDLVDRVEDGWDRDDVHGDTRHVHSLLSSLNRAIHSMQSTVEDIRRHGERDRGHDDHHGDHDDHRSHGAAPQGHCSDSPSSEA